VSFPSPVVWDSLCANALTPYRAYMGAFGEFGARRRLPQLSQTHFDQKTYDPDFA